MLLCYNNNQDPGQEEAESHSRDIVHSTDNLLTRVVVMVVSVVVTVVSVVAAAGAGLVAVVVTRAIAGRRRVPA